MIEFLDHPYLFDLSWGLISLYMKAWVVTLLVGFVRYNKLGPVQKRLLFFASVSIVMEYLSMANGTRYLFHPASNSPWYHLLTPLLFYSYVSISLPVVFPQEWYKLRWWLGAGIWVLTIINIFWGDGFYKFPSMVVGVYSIAGITCALGYFFHLLGTLSIRYLERDPLFLMSCGFLIYFSGNFLNWLSFNLVTYEPGFYGTVTAINQSLGILLNALFIIALLLRPTPSAEHAGRQIAMS